MQDGRQADNRAGLDVKLGRGGRVVVCTSFFPICSTANVHSSSTAALTSRSKKIDFLAAERSK